MILKIFLPWTGGELPSPLCFLSSHLHLSIYLPYLSFIRNCLEHKEFLEGKIKKNPPYLVQIVHLLPFTREKGAPLTSLMGKFQPPGFNMPYELSPLFGQMIFDILLSMDHQGKSSGRCIFN